MDEALGLSVRTRPVCAGVATLDLEPASRLDPGAGVVGPWRCRSARARQRCPGLGTRRLHARGSGRRSPRPGRRGARRRPDASGRRSRRAGAASRCAGSCAGDRRARRAHACLVPRSGRASWYRRAGARLAARAHSGGRSGRPLQDAATGSSRAGAAPCRSSRADTAPVRRAAQDRRRSAGGRPGSSARLPRRAGGVAVAASRADPVAPPSHQRGSGRAAGNRSPGSHHPWLRHGTGSAPPRSAPRSRSATPTKAASVAAAP